MCTSIFVSATDKSYLLGRTMDWYDLYVSPIFVPRNYQWQSIYNHHPYQNKYAVVGTGFQDQNLIDLSDGINEWGLSVQKLTFANGTNLTTEKNDANIQLAAFEFVLYTLGNFKSIADLEKQLPTIQLMALKSQLKHGGDELHFAISDASGRSIVIEPSHFPLKVIENPLGVVTNMPSFEKQLAKMDSYLDFTPKFLAGNSPLGAFHVTTGKQAGKKQPSGGYTPSQRFVKAAWLKEMVDVPANELEAADLAFKLLDAVSVPKSKAHRPTYTVYQTVTSAQSLSYYFKPVGQAQIFGVSLNSDLLNRPTVKVFQLPSTWQATMLY